MGMDIGTYGARIGTFIVNVKRSIQQEVEVKMAGKQIWFLGLVTVTLFLIGGVKSDFTIGT
jgi:hypothetical protein